MNCISDKKIQIQYKQSTQKISSAVICMLFALLFCIAPLMADNVTLCYHKFDYSLGHLYAVLPDVFEWQIQYIKDNKIDIVHLKEVVDKYTPYAKNMGDNVLITIDDGWKDVNNIVPIIEKENVPVTLYIFPSVINNTRAYLSLSDINALKKLDLIDFGCHSYSHPILMHANSTTLYREVIESKDDLKKMVGRKIDTFAYPYGMFDEKTKQYASKYYSIIFGVNSDSNKNTTDKYNLNRFIIYKNTTFGEFIDTISYVKGKHHELGYSIKSLGEGRGYGKYFEYTKVRLYKFPVENKENTVLIVPGSYLGAGWVYKVLDRLKGSNIQTYAIVNRNNNIPFYRPDKEMSVITTWGLEAFMQDLKMALDHITETNKRIIIFTWGDGFDLVMATLSADAKYKDIVKGIITINPSVITDDNTKDTFEKSVNYYDGLLSKGGYAAENLSQYLKIKTLSDLMVLKANESSPFASELGYKNVTNEEILMKEMDREDHPDFSIGYGNNEYTIAEFKEAFMKPLPLFSMVIPNKLLRDINNLWYNDFHLTEYGINKDKLTYPVVYLYSPYYIKNVDRITNSLTGLKNIGKYLYKDASTVEIMLSDTTSSIFLSRAISMFK